MARMPDIQVQIALVDKAEIEKILTDFLKDLSWRRTLIVLSVLSALQFGWGFAIGFCIHRFFS